MTKVEDLQFIFSHKNELALPARQSAGKPAAFSTLIGDSELPANNGGYFGTFASHKVQPTPSLLQNTNPKATSFSPLQSISIPNDPQSNEFGGPATAEAFGSSAAPSKWLAEFDLQSNLEPNANIKVPNELKQHALAPITGNSEIDGTHSISSSESSENSPNKLSMGAAISLNGGEQQVLPSVDRFPNQQRIDRSIASAGVSGKTNGEVNLPANIETPTVLDRTDNLAGSPAERTDAPSQRPIFDDAITVALGAPPVRNSSGTQMTAPFPENAAGEQASLRTVSTAQSDVEKIQPSEKLNAGAFAPISSKLRLKTSSAGSVASMRTQASEAGPTSLELKNYKATGGTSTEVNQNSDSDQLVVNDLNAKSGTRTPNSQAHLPGVYAAIRSYANEPNATRPSADLPDSSAGIDVEQKASLQKNVTKNNILPSIHKGNATVLEMENVADTKVIQSKDVPELTKEGKTIATTTPEVARLPTSNVVRPVDIGSGNLETSVLYHSAKQLPALKTHAVVVPNRAMNQTIQPVPNGVTGNVEQSENLATQAKKAMPQNIMDAIHLPVSTKVEHVAINAPTHSSNRTPITRLLFEPAIETGRNSSGPTSTLASHGALVRAVESAADRSFENSAAERSQPADPSAYRLSQPQDLSLGTPASERTRPEGRQKFAEALISQIKSVDSSDGRTRIVLQPSGLGSIDVEILSELEKTTRVVIRVENPTVLQSLREERSLLAHAIGVSDENTLEFRQNSPDQRSEFKNADLTEENRHTDELDESLTVPGKPAGIVGRNQLDIVT